MGTPDSEDPPPPSRRRGSALIVSGAVVVAAGLVLGAILLIVGNSGTSSTSGRPSSTAPGPPPSSSTASPPSSSTASPPTPPPAPPARPAPTTEQFGVSVNRLFNDGTYTAQQIDSQLSALHATGATIARGDALWEATEPSAPVGGVHRFDWTFDDQIATALAQHGLRWLPIIDYTALWAESIQGTDHSPPRSLGDYAAYAGAFAARYGTGGSFWRVHPELTRQPVDTFEIWNEPDSPHFWLPTPDPGRYAGLYASARDAIAVQDPGARVIIGGLSNPGAFMPALLHTAPDLRGRIDGVGIHPYGPDPRAVLGAVRRARATLVSLGLGSVPLYVTELGWPTHPPGSEDWAPERLRPRYIQRTIATLGHTDCKIAMTILYTWVTPERDPANREDWFGIESPTGASTPDVQALTAGLHAATAVGPQVPECAA